MMKTILLLLVGLDLLAFLLYGYDKLAAKTGNVKLRIPEKTLLLLAAAGGPGALLAMELFRHKTKHKNFRLLVPLFAILQLALAAFLYIKLR